MLRREYEKGFLEGFEEAREEARVAAREEARQAAARESAREVAQRALAKGWTAERIQEITDLSAEEIEALRKSMSK